MLLVEDDATLARSVGRLLSMYVDVQYACSLSQALEALAAADRLDAVWSDRQLGGPDDGIDILVAARQNHPDALLLLVSGTLETKGLERLPADVVVMPKSRTSAATELVRRRLAAP
jgi:DNA-binding NtrC family response regulator